MKAVISKIVVTCSFSRKEAEKLVQFGMVHGYVFALRNAFHNAKFPHPYRDISDDLEFFINNPEGFKAAHGREDFQIKFYFYADQIDLAMIQQVTNDFISNIP